MSKLKPWQWGAIAVGGIILVGTAVDVIMGSDEPQAEAPAPGRIVATDRILSAELPVFTMLVEPTAERGAMEDRARRLCEGATHCDVIGWTDRALVATGWPMTERETEGVVFSYKLNRSTGLERALWDCAVFADTPSDQCLS